MQGLDKNSRALAYIASRVGVVHPTTMCECDSQAFRKDVMAQLKRINGKLAIILLLRSDGWCLKAVAELLGYRTKERIRQLERIAIKQLRGPEFMEMLAPHLKRKICHRKRC